MNEILPTAALLDGVWASIIKGCETIPEEFAKLSMSLTIG